MSFRSKIYLSVIIISVLAIVCVRGYRYFHDLKQRNNFSQTTESGDFFPFGIPEKDANPASGLQDTLEQVVVEEIPDSGPVVIAAPEMKVKPIFNPDAFMSLSEATLDVSEKVDDKLAVAVNERVNKYANDPAMQAFNRDLDAVLGNGVTLEEIFDPKLGAKYLNDPQIQKILLQYTNNPAFMKLMQEMLSDSEFIKTVGQNIGQPAPNATKK